MPRLMSWTVGFFAAALQITAADAQGNIDAGKTPAQIFGDTCSACHRNARELRRASASFLRAHYTTGSDEAAAMASYLAGLGDGRASQPNQAAQPKRPPGEAKQAARAPVEQPRSERPGPAAAQPRNRPAANVSSTAQARVIAEERHPDPPPPPAPPAPVLVPFEE